MLNLKALAVETITAPRQAAARLLELRLSMNNLWLLVALAAVVNTILYSLSIMLFESQYGLTTGMNQPALYLMLLVAVIVIGSLVIRWIGQILNGKASLPEILTLMVWLQFMRALVQAGLLAVMLIVPGLSNIIAMAVGLFGLWIMVNFLDVAQGWSSLGKSFLVLVLTGLGFVFGLSFFLLLIGATSVGI